MKIITDWNRFKFYDYEELLPALTAVSVTERKRKVHSEGISGLSMGTDYVPVGKLELAPDVNIRLLNLECKHIATGNETFIGAYFPLNWEASKLIGSKYIGGTEGEWCTASNNVSFWNDYIYKRGGVLLYVVYQETKYAILIHPNNSWNIFDQFDYPRPEGSHETNLPKIDVSDLIKLNLKQIDDVRAAHNENIPDSMKFEAAYMKKDLKTLAELYKKGVHGEIWCYSYIVADPSDYPKDMAELVINNIPKEYFVPLIYDMVNYNRYNLLSIYLEKFPDIEIADNLCERIGKGLLSDIRGYESGVSDVAENMLKLTDIKTVSYLMSYLGKIALSTHNIDLFKKCCEVVGGPDRLLFPPNPLGLTTEIVDDFHWTGKAEEYFTAIPEGQITYLVSAMTTYNMGNGIDIAKICKHIFEGTYTKEVIEHILKADDHSWFSALDYYSAYFKVKEIFISDEDMIEMYDWCLDQDNRYNQQPFWFKVTKENVLRLSSEILIHIFDTSLKLTKGKEIVDRMVNTIVDSANDSQYRKINTKFFNHLITTGHEELLQDLDEDIKEAARGYGE